MTNAGPLLEGQVESRSHASISIVRIAKLLTAGVMLFHLSQGLLFLGRQVQAGRRAAYEVMACKADLSSMGRCMYPEPPPTDWGDEYPLGQQWPPGWDR